MSLYADYVFERQGKATVEFEHGFATYGINGKEVYIEDIYVHPEHRKTGLAAKLADEIARLAKINGCVTMVGTVDPKARGGTTSLRVLLGYGMTLHSVQNGLIYFVKEIP